MKAINRAVILIITTIVISLIGGRMVGIDTDDDVNGAIRGVAAGVWAGWSQLLP
jgi:hypothetical protein